ncbi:hypothetical protein MMC25_000523 [Agyrium rufum]|nr:hypothetical protein [Agyrium rufum]
MRDQEYGSHPGWDQITDDDASRELAKENKRLLERNRIFTAKLASDRDYITRLQGRLKELTYVMEDGNVEDLSEAKNTLARKNAYCIVLQEQMSEERKSSNILKKELRSQVTKQALQIACLSRAMHKQKAREKSLRARTVRYSEWVRKIEDLLRQRLYTRDCIEILNDSFDVILADNIQLAQNNEDIFTQNITLSAVDDAKDEEIFRLQELLDAKTTACSSVQALADVREAEADRLQIVVDGQKAETTAIQTSYAEELARLQGENKELHDRLLAMETKMSLQASEAPATEARETDDTITQLQRERDDRLWDSAGDHSYVADMEIRAREQQRRIADLETEIWTLRDGVSNMGVAGVEEVVTGTEYVNYIGSTIKSPSFDMCALSSSSDSPVGRAMVGSERSLNLEKESSAAQPVDLMECV